MRYDISYFLKKWEYKLGKTVRRIMGEDGKEKIQVRLPLGIEQFEVDGRPDGKRPHGRESLFDYYLARLRSYRRRVGTDKGFVLNSEDCVRLGEEGVLYYYRYIVFFQIKDYIHTTRDTERNLRMLDFVSKYAGDEGDSILLEQYRPYLIRINKAARSLLLLEQNDYERALKEIADGIKRIENLPQIASAIFLYEKQRSLIILRELARGVRKRKPLSESEILQRSLDQAVQREDYEKAAELRDRLIAIRKRKKR